MARYLVRIMSARRCLHCGGALGRAAVVTPRRVVCGSGGQVCRSCRWLDYAEGEGWLQSR